VAGVTDTTQTQTMPPVDTGAPRSPEYRLAVNALSGLREDLFRDVLALRPLPRGAADGWASRRLPAPLRSYAGLGPQAAVAVLALLALFAGATPGGAGNSWPPLLRGLLCAAPVLATLVRPVAAFWLSLAVSAVVALYGEGWGPWPWTPGTLVCHLAVVVIVAARTRPRTAAWMWLLTAGWGMCLRTLLGGDHYGDNSASLLALSALALLVVVVWHIRRDAQRQVSEERTVTAHERSRRTLLEERTTIARELHDVVAHHMSVVAIQAEAAPYRVDSPPPELEQAFRTIRENAVAALTELRRVLGVVRAQDYEAPDAPQPALADLDALLANVRDAGLTVDRAVTGAVRELSPGVELSAYRIVQEALSNTLRHAPGASARVELSYVLGGLGLRVVNGPVPEPSLVKPSPGAGHGITGMRERVSMLDGVMTAGRTADGGFEVAVFLPAALPDTLPAALSDDGAA
jgi:hypothetical protein